HVHGTVENKLGTPLIAEQLARATRALPRWRAARVLGRRNEPRAVAALSEGLKEDAFWAVRAECAMALGEQRTAEALAALLRGIDDPSAKVRRAIAGALGRFRMNADGDRGAEAATAIIRWIEKGDRSYLVESELRRALGRTRDPRAVEQLTRLFESD